MLVSQFPKEVKKSVKMVICKKLCSLEQYPKHSNSSQVVEICVYVCVAVYEFMIKLIFGWVGACMHTFVVACVHVCPSEGHFSRQYHI